VLRVPATILLAGSIAGLALPRVALAAPASSSASSTPSEGPSIDGQSVGGPSIGASSEPPKSRGELELGLGVLLTGTAAGLIAFGSVQLIRAREHVEFCRPDPPIFIDELDEPSGGIDPCMFDPPALGFASAGLSWGFSAALLVGAGLLLARGARLQAGARRADRDGRKLASRLSVSPWLRAGGGATLSWRF
jgi:hypothetical protein